MTSEFFFFGLPLQMKLGHIYYMHDSTESTEDSFTLSASAYEIERRSLPFTISVAVIPVNDEPPKLTRNTGLEVAPFPSFDTSRPAPLGLEETTSTSNLPVFASLFLFPAGDFSIITARRANQT